MSDPSSSSSSHNNGVAPSGAAPDDDASGTVSRLCSKIHKRIGITSDEPLPVADHRKATDYMLRVRDLLLDDTSMLPEAKTCILCAGIACARRICCGADGEDTMRNLTTTMTLLFVLLVLAEGGEDMEDDNFEAVDQEKLERVGDEGYVPKRILRTDENLLSAWEQSSVADSLFAATGVHASSWASALRSDASISRAALREARYLKDDSTMNDFSRLAAIFFRCSTMATVSSMIAMAGGGGRRDYMTLDRVADMHSAIQHHGETLDGIADAAESEAGQQVLRDMILSMKLPQAVVGVRRTVLMSREANAIATRMYTSVLNEAHDAAMRGASWSWRSDEDPIHKLAALLSGLAVIMSKQKDGIRKGDAFAGRVNLPFIECRPPPPDVARLALVQSTGEWVVYSVNSSGHPRVQLKDTGFSGMCSGVLLLLQSTSR